VQAFSSVLNSLFPSLPPSHLTNILQSHSNDSFAIPVLGKSEFMLQPVSPPLCCFEHGRVPKKTWNRSDQPSGESNIEMWSSIHISSQELQKKYSVLYFMYLKLKHRGISNTMVSRCFRISKIQDCPEV